MHSPSARRALVLGSSDGIGLGMARRLADAGWRVLGLSRSEAPDLATVAGLRQVVCDVAEPGLEETLEALWEEDGPFDLVVHCVGVGSGVEENGLREEQRTFATNLGSLVAVVETLIPRMRARGWGHLIGLSSLADLLHIHDAPSYGASKAGYSSYLRALALHLRGSGVAVTNVRLGFVDTKMAQAPVRPFLKSVEQAVDLLCRCVERRPVQISWPKSMTALVRMLRGLQDLRMWFVRQR